MFPLPHGSEGEVELLLTERSTQARYELSGRDEMITQGVWKCSEYCEKEIEAEYRDVAVAER